MRVLTGKGIAAALSEAAAAATEGAEATKGMKASAGRSSHVPDKALQDTADPGASAVAIWLQAAAQAVQ